MIKSTEDYIDILNLYVNHTAKDWNAFLSQAYRAGDINGLLNTRRRLQVGMDKACAQKMNSEKINIFFLRLQVSIEKTIKQIVRYKNPHPLDNPKNKDKWIHTQDTKRQRDHELERLYKDSGY